MKWFYQHIVILLIVLIAAIVIAMAICMIGRITLINLIQRSQIV